MSVLFIDGFDNYTLLEDKWSDVYKGASIVQGIGKRDTAGLQIGSSYSSDNTYLGLDIEDTDNLVIGFAYKKNLSKQVSTNNIALNKPAYAESIYLSNHPYYAVDGNRSSMWQASAAGVTTWIKIDLLDVKNICGFGLELVYGLENSWTYYGSNNDVDWYSIVSEPIQSCNGLITTMSGIDVNYRYIIADITPNGSYRASVASFHVYEFVDGTREDVCTTSLSFLKDGLEQCSINLGAENITFLYGFSGEAFLEDYGFWGEDSYNNHTGVTEDCFFYALSSDTNYNTTYIAVGCGSSPLRINRSQLKFDLSYLKNIKDTTHPSLAITTARLYLYATSTVGGPNNVSIYRCLKDWNESEATWNKFCTNGTYEIPSNIYTTGVTRWAGAGEVYTTITAAVAAANDGDIIALMDESYGERAIINKWVHIIGVKETTSYPGNLVQVYSGGNDTNNFEYNMSYDCPFPDPYDKTIIMENIYSRCWGNRTDAFSRTTDVTGTVLVNKCYIYSGSASSYVIRGNIGENKHDTQFYNCKFYHGEYLAVTIQGTWQMNNCLIYCWSGTTVDNLLNSSTPSPSDYVITTTSGYGYDYGELLLPVTLDIYWNSPGCSAVTSGIISGTLEDGIYDRVGIAEDIFNVPIAYTGWMSWDITTLANMWLDGTAKQYGVHIKSDNENINNNVSMYSSTGNDGNRPRLDLRYTTAVSGIEVNNCMVSGTWNYVETKINFDAVNGSVDIKVNESFVLTASGISTTISGNDKGINSLAMHSNNGILVTPEEYVYSYIDDLYVCNVSGTTNNDFLGVCLVDVAYPSASGTNNDYDIHYYYDDKRYEVIDGVTYERDIIYETTIPITNSANDGYFNSRQSFITSTNSIEWEGWTDIYGYDGKSFFRFHGINIPKNATILEAKLKFVPYESGFINFIYMDGRFENSGVPTIAPISEADLESRELTSIESRASWSGDYAITSNSSENLKNSLQELIDRDDWLEENNTVTIIVGFGGYYGYDAYVRFRSYDWVWGQYNPQNYLSYLPQVYIKWKVAVIYDMSEYVQSTVNSYKDTYYHDTTTTSGVTVSGLSDIYAIQHNLKSKYIVNSGAENDLGCKSVVIVSGTEYYSSLIDYTTSSGFYGNELILFDENPETLSSWTGDDIANIEAGSVII